MFEKTYEAFSLAVANLATTDAPIAERVSSALKTIRRIEFSSATGFDYPEDEEVRTDIKKLISMAENDEKLDAKQASDLILDTYKYVLRLRIGELYNVPATEVQIP